MKSTKLLSIGLLALSVGVIACAPQQLPTSAPMTPETRVAGQGSLLPRPGHAIVSFIVRWPMQTQAMPIGTDRIVIVLKAAGQEVGRKELSRTDSPTQTAEFDLNPALGLLNVEVEAFKGQALTARGSTSLVLRDNSVTRASVILTPTEGLEVSNDEALAVLNAPTLFNHWAGYLSPYHEQGQDLAEALGAVTRYMPGLGYPLLSFVSSLPVRQASSLEPLGFAMSNHRAEIENSLLKRLLWPGYAVDFEQDSTAPTRLFKARLNPDEALGTPADATTGQVTVKVTGSDWQDDVRLARQGQFMKDQQQVSRSFFLHGGQFPAAGSVSYLSADAEIVPNGNEAKRAKAKVEASVFRESSHPMNLWGMVMGFAGPSLDFFGLPYPEGRFLPTLVKLSLDNPDLKTTDLTVTFSPEMTRARLLGKVQLRDDKQLMHTLDLDVSIALTFWSQSPGSYPNGMHVTFNVLDDLTQLRIAGSYIQRAEAYGSKLEVHADCYNHASSELLGSVHYAPETLPDMSRIAHWPVLKLKNADGTTTDIPLTPAYFMGAPDSGGGLGINIK